MAVTSERRRSVRTESAVPGKVLISSGEGLTRCLRPPRSGTFVRSPPWKRPLTCTNADQRPLPTHSVPDTCQMDSRQLKFSAASAAALRAAPRRFRRSSRVAGRRARRESATRYHLTRLRGQPPRRDSGRRGSASNRLDDDKWRRRPGKAGQQEDRPADRSRPGLAMRSGCRVRPPGQEVSLIGGEDHNVSRSQGHVHCWRTPHPGRQPPRRAHDKTLPATAGDCRRLSATGR